MPLLTSKELAHELQESERHVWTLLQRGDIPSYKIGRSRRFDLEEVRDHLRVKPTPLMTPQARARRDVQRILAGQVVRRLDAQRKWKVG